MEYAGTLKMENVISILLYLLNAQAINSLKSLDTNGAGNGPRRGENMSKKCCRCDTPLEWMEGRMTTFLTEQLWWCEKCWDDTTSVGLTGEEDNG